MKTNSRWRPRGGHSKSDGAPLLPGLYSNLASIGPLSYLTNFKAFESSVATSSSLVLFFLKKNARSPELISRLVSALGFISKQKSNYNLNQLWRILNLFKYALDIDGVLKPPTLYCTPSKQIMASGWMALIRELFFS